MEEMYLSNTLKCHDSKERFVFPDVILIRNALTNSMETFTSLDRIKTTPIPWAYSIHLKQTLYVYLLSLPFQVVHVAYWATIFIIFVASMILLGIERIGSGMYIEVKIDLAELRQLFANALFTIP